MLRSFRRLLRRSKDHEASPISPESPPDTSSATKDSYGDRSPPALLLPRRARPQLAAHLARLRRQHADLQRRYRLLPPARPTIRRTKLKAAVARAAAEARPAEPAPAAAAPLRPANRAPRGVLASRSTARTLSSYRTKEEKARAVLKEAPLKHEASLGAWAATSEDGSRALRQAASAQRMRRLRRFSQTHNQDGAGGVEPASAAVQPDSPHAAALKDKAWSIMAGLNLDDLDKKRGVGVQRKATWDRGGGGSSGGDSGTRRQTEPPTHREEVAIKAARSPSDDSPGFPAAAPGDDGKEGFKWRGLSLGRPRTRAAVR